jgi:hypothetical protein
MQIGGVRTFLKGFHKKTKYIYSSRGNNLHGGNFKKMPHKLLKNLEQHWINLQLPE